MIVNYNYTYKSKHIHLIHACNLFAMGWSTDGYKGLEAIEADPCAGKAEGQWGVVTLESVLL